MNTCASSKSTGSGEDENHVLPPSSLWSTWGGVVSPNGAPLLEVFLFDFAGDLYGAELDVAFISFIRDELKFDSVDALVKRMNDDSARARADLAAAPHAYPKLGSIG